MLYINNLNKKMIKDKVSYVLCDFDRTISDYHSPTSWQIFEESCLVPGEYKCATRDLFEKYRPIELDNEIDMNKKNKYMRTWAIEQTSLFSKYHIDINLYHRIIRETSGIILRRDFPSFVYDMYKLNIPIYIVSGGLLDPITDALVKNKCLLTNVSIITNTVKVDDKQIVGLNEPILHSLNKDCISLPVSEDELGLLFGDLPTDKLLATNLRTIDCGFVNGADLNVYNQCFDICLTGSSSFSNVSKIFLKQKNKR